MRTFLKFLSVGAWWLFIVLGVGLVLFGTESFRRSDELLGAAFLLGLGWVLEKYLWPMVSNGRLFPPSRNDAQLMFGAQFTPGWIVAFVLGVGYMVTAAHGVLGFRQGANLSLQSPSVPSLDAAVQNHLEPSALDSLAREMGTGTLTPLAAVIDVEARSLHPLHRDLPAGMRAQSPEDISTVIYVESTRQADGVRLLRGAVIPFHRRSWHISMATLEAGVRSVVYRQSFVGESVARGARGFRPDLDGEMGLYISNSVTNPRNVISVRGAELLYGDSGGAELTNGQRVVGVVGPPPTDDALDWITDPEKWVEGTGTGQLWGYTVLRVLLWIFVFGGLIGLLFYEDARQEARAASEARRSIGEKIDNIKGGR